MLIILGNGFDINLGFKTSYKDFVTHVESKKQWALNETNFFKYILNKKVNDDERWVDLENQLKNYVHSRLQEIVSKKRSTNPNEINKPFIERYKDPELESDILKLSKEFRKEFAILNETLVAYLKEELKNEIPEDSHAKEYIKRVKQFYMPGNTDLPGSQIDVLSFNYSTDYSVKKLLTDSKEDETKIHYHNIHGEIDNGNVILGIEGKSDLPPTFSFLKKGLHYNYSKGINIEMLLRRHHVIHFYGFSLGETDAPYFRQFFGAFSSPTRIFNQNETFDSKRIVIYHYGEKGYNQIIHRIDELTDYNVDRLRQYNRVEFIDIEGYQGSSQSDAYFDTGIRTR